VRHLSKALDLVGSLPEAPRWLEEELARVRPAGSWLARMMACKPRMLVTVALANPDRIVVDVSGDGRDNCNPRIPVDALRDELVAGRITINGLPILEGNEAATLSQWYRDHVIGGSGAFLLPARGFQEFARAVRQKFITEISAASR